MLASASLRVVPGRRARPKMRPSLTSTLRPKTPSESGTSDAADFGSWLTADLRIKGAPVESNAPPAEPSPESPRTIIVPPPDVEQAALANWLTVDLRPRHSQPPDSLAPQIMPPSEVAVPSEAPVAAADLEADDLAVLPGRAGGLGRSGAKHRRRSAALLALLALGLAGVLGVMLRGGRGASSGAEFVSAAGPREPIGALPPPPPTDLPPVVEPEIAPTPRRAYNAGAAPELEAEDPLLGPRGRNWARYADLPSPTLSRLAREERELAKQRDDERRRAAKRKKLPE